MDQKENIEIKEEEKKTNEEVGEVLDDAELDQVAGGGEVGIGVGLFK